MSDQSLMGVPDAIQFISWFETSAKQALSIPNEEGLKLLHQLMGNSFASFQAANGVLYVETDRLVGENSGLPGDIAQITKLMWLQFKSSSLLETMQVFAQAVTEAMAQAQAQGTNPVDDPEAARAANAFAGLLDQVKK